MFSVVTILLILGAADHPQSGQAGWGQTASPEELRSAESLLIMPAGAGLPVGSGDAERGAELYEQYCQVCHGASGSGGSGGALAGGVLVGDAPSKTVGSYWPYAPKIFDYVRRAMPYGRPASLDNADYYALTAYILYINNVIDQKQIIDAESLPQVIMPNQDGFISAYPRRPDPYR